MTKNQLKLKYLRATQRMWEWLAGHPTKSKSAYAPGCKFINMCPLCAYRHAVDYNACGGQCLLAKHVWPQGCMSDDTSALIAWGRAKDRKSYSSVTRHAQRIVDACRIEIQKLTRKRKRRARKA